MSSKPGANLAQLPAELLVKILSWISAPINYDNLHYVENANFTNIASIKNLRLTCRRFENLTTPALFGIVTVLICEPQSIEALENVSRHSLLSRHVKAVRVQLGFYDALFAKNDTTLSSPTRTAVGKLVQSWTLPTHQQPDATDPDSSLSILAGIQAEYRDRYDRQEQMHGSGDAIRRIAQAMSRMPTATRLVLEDYPPRPWHFGALLVSVLDSNNVDQSRLAQLVFPLSWISCWRLKIDSVYKSELRHLRPRFEFVVDLPVAIHRAGVRLTALRVLGLQIPDSVPSWGAVDPASFQEACQSLQTLEVTPQYRNEYCNLLTRQVFNPWSTSFGVANTQQMPLSQIVDQICMLNLNLRHLHIDCASMEFYDDNDPDSHTCDRLFKSFRWPSLEVIYVESARINYGITLLDMIRQLANIYEVRLHGLSFSSFCPSRGNPSQEGWADMLDGLKNEVQRLRENEARRRGKQKGQELPIRVRNATLFWEPADGTPPELQSRVDAFFNDEEDDGFSRVDDYIRGAADINPLVDACERGILDYW